MRKFNVNVAGVDTLVSENLLQFDNDGRVYKHYNTDMTLDIDTIQSDILIESEKIIKEAKDKALDELVVTTNLVPFDANAQSINYMSSVVALASAEYCLQISLGSDPVLSYDSIFKTVVQWKNADNTISNVQIETVKEALREAMLSVSSIKTVDNQ